MEHIYTYDRVLVKTLAVPLDCNLLVLDVFSDNLIVTDRL